jgi:hypothetical protein
MILSYYRDKEKVVGVFVDFRAISTKTSVETQFVKFQKNVYAFFIFLGIIEFQPKFYRFYIKIILKLEQLQRSHFGAVTIAPRD